MESSARSRVNASGGRYQQGPVSSPKGMCLVSQEERPLERKDTGEDIGEEQTPATNTSDARVASSVGPDADEAERSQAKEWNADWGLGRD